MTAIAMANGGSASQAQAGQSADDAALRWYVVHIQPHGEDRAVENLNRQAFTTFCPRITKTVRHARKTTKIRAPLFPGYLFIQLDPKRDRWRAINGTRGVVRLLAQGETPIPVPKGIVEALRARMSDDGVVDWASSLKVGQAVRILDGPFANFVGSLEMLDGAGRVRVLLDLMGRSVVVALPGDTVSPVP
jgi:transcription elongation factor/antiterminator RfaH